MTFPLLLQLSEDDYALLCRLREHLSALSGKELTLEQVTTLCIGYAVDSNVLSIFYPPKES